MSIDSKACKEPDQDAGSIPAASTNGDWIFGKSYQGIAVLDHKPCVDRELWNVVPPQTRCSKCWKEVPPKILFLLKFKNVVG